jgi:hypothetical protein
VIRALAVFGALALLSACGDADGDSGPGGVTVGEARALDEAAEMLDQQRLPDEALIEPEAVENWAEPAAPPSVAEPQAE